MTAHDPNLGRPETPRRRSGLLHWLGLSPAADGPAESADTPAPAPEIGERRSTQRDQLLDDIGRFLGRHGLELNTATLAIAHDYLTGSDPELVRAIDARQRERQPVGSEWLEAIGRAGPGKDLEELRALMARLETSLDDFAQTSSTAKSATMEYGTALEAHVGALDQAGKASEVIAELAALTRVMLARTREIERAMTRSEQQTRMLQKRLDEARRTAEQDHLTGLPNRRAFEARFESECRAAQQSGEKLSVAFCDIDHFKAINDRHGHDAGDRVLKVVARALARISNDRCHVARHGGEEFVVLFRGITLAEAVTRLDTAREEMAGRRLVNRATDLPFGQVTFSAGIADVGAFASRSAALKAADTALYRAKQSGRNRIAIARADEGGTPPSAP